MNVPQVNVQQLISFYVVAKEKSVSIASEKLFISQPAVTQQLKALEAQYGVKLINVKRKRVHLTKAGERLLAYTEEIVNHLMMAENFLKSYRVNNLHIGVASTLTLYLTPIFDRFKELHPSVRVIVREGPSLILVDELLDFKFDVCLVGTLMNMHKKLHIFRIPQIERWVLAANPEHPLVMKPKVKWEDLTHYPLILQPEGSIAREVILEHFRSRNLTPQVGTEVDNIGCAKELARQKKGIALMFLPNVKEEVAQGRLKIIPITDGEIRLGIDIVLNQEAALSPSIKALLDLVAEHFGLDTLQEVKEVTPPFSASQWTGTSNSRRRAGKPSRMTSGRTA